MDERKNQAREGRCREKELKVVVLSQGRVDESEHWKLRHPEIRSDLQQRIDGELSYFGRQLDSQIVRFHALHPQSRHHKGQVSF